jgi:ABC-type uncharacterized transport system permease subunit
MRTIDKVIFAVLGISAVLLFVVGFNASTGYAIALSDAATKIGEIGSLFWFGLLFIFIGLLILVKSRRQELKE